MRSEADLRQLAMDICDNKVFGTWNIREGDSAGIAFMALALMSEKQIAEMAKRDVKHVYAYISDAAPRQINGYPCFFGHRELTSEEATRLQPLIDEVMAFRRSFAKPSETADG